MPLCTRPYDPFPSSGPSSSPSIGQPPPSDLHPRDDATERGTVPSELENELDGDPDASAMQPPLELVRGVQAASSNDDSAPDDDPLSLPPPQPPTGAPAPSSPMASGGSHPALSSRIATPSAALASAGAPSAAAAAVAPRSFLRSRCITELVGSSSMRTKKRERPKPSEQSDTKEGMPMAGCAASRPSEWQSLGRFCLLG